MAEIAHYIRKNSFETQGALAVAANRVKAQPHLYVVAADGAVRGGDILQFPRPTFPKEETLFDESNKTTVLQGIQKEWIQEEKEWYLLPGTGFDVASEIDRFCSNVLQGIEEGKTFDATVSSAFLEVSGNIYGFSLEYLQSKAMLPFKHKIIRQDDGGIRLVPFGSERLLRDLISPQERYGAVLRSTVRLEDELAKANVGDIFVTTSPSGWTGFVGKTYVETQTKLMEVALEDGEEVLKGHTIRSMLNISQNIAFMEAVGADVTSFFERDERKQLAIISEAVKPVLGEEWTVLSLTKKIQELAESDIAYEGYTFDQIVNDINHFDECLAVDRLTQLKVKMLEGFVKKELGAAWDNIVKEGSIPDEVIKKLEKALGISVLDLSDAVKNGKAREESEAGKTVDDFELIVLGKKELGFDVRGELDRVQNLPGCNGGGKKDQSSSRQYILIKTADGYRMISTDGEYDFKPENGPCQSCGKDVPCGDCHLCVDCDIKAREENAGAE